MIINIKFKDNWLIYINKKNFLILKIKDIEDKKINISKNFQNYLIIIKLIKQFGLLK